MTNDGRTDTGTDQRDWLPCVSAIAKSGQHDSCSIDRKSAAPCSGEVRNVDTSRMEVPAAAPEAPPAPAQPPMPAGPALPAKPDHRPAAVPAPPSAATQPPPPAPSPHDQAEPAPDSADETKGHLETSKENPDNAGSAIDNAAKKTWDCISSLFKKC